MRLGSKGRDSALRIAHSVIRRTGNKVMHRFAMFAAGSLLPAALCVLFVVQFPMHA